MDEGATAPPPRGFFRPRRNYLHAQNLGFIAYCDVDGVREKALVKNTGRCRELLFQRILNTSA